jgi:UDPglucose--hexose-1-phosphate uridylyltransferase
LERSGSSLTGGASPSEPGAGFRKERETKEDGRYIVFYGFGAGEPGGPLNGPPSDGARADGNAPERAPQEAERPVRRGKNEMRWDPTLGEWVAYATHRQDRTFLPPAEYCPLDPTQPGGFPTEVPRSSYDIVVFENKFPSLSPHAGEPDEPGSALSPTAPGWGVCEVVLYSQDHASTLAGMSEERTRNLVEVWADRYVELGALPYTRYVFVFENKGEAIGVTLHHPHGQIYAYPFIPPRPKKELDAAREHRRKTGSCLHCDLLARELEDGRRIVAEGEHFVAFVPFSAHYPYEAHIYAKRCAPSIANLTGPERGDLAAVLKKLLVGYDELFGFSLPYVMAMHQAPTDGPAEGYEGLAHFHIEFYPPNRTESKLKYLAGSEQGAGAFIMDALPEETAKRLREAVESASAGTGKLPA